MSIEGIVEWEGKEIEVSAQAKRSATGGKIEAFSLAINKIPLAAKLGTAPVPDIDGIKPDGAYLSYDNVSDLKLDGIAANATGSARLWGTVNIGEGPVTIGNVDDMTVASVIAFEHVSGSDKIEIKPSRLHFGAFDGVLEGAIGPEPEPAKIDGSAASNPGYRFELVTERAKSAPQDSTEQPLIFNARVAGRYDPTVKRLDVSEIAVRSNDESELYGQAGATFGQGSPAMNLNLRIPQNARFAG